MCETLKENNEECEEIVKTKEGVEVISIFGVSKMGNVRG